jgi:hypothetical protein
LSCWTGVYLLFFGNGTRTSCEDAGGALKHAKASTSKSTGERIGTKEIL